MAKFKRLITLSVGENMEQPELSYTAGWSENKGPASLENIFAVSYIVKYTLTIWHKIKKNLSPYKSLYVKVYSSFVDNSPKLEITHMSIKRW